MAAHAALDHGCPAGPGARRARRLLRALRARAPAGLLRAVWAFVLGRVLVHDADRRAAVLLRDAVHAHLACRTTAFRNPQKRTDDVRRRRPHGTLRLET